MHVHSSGQEFGFAVSHSCRPEGMIRVPNSPDESQAYAWEAIHNGPVPAAMHPSHAWLRGILSPCALVSCTSPCLEVREARWTNIFTSWKGTIFPDVAL